MKPIVRSVLSGSALVAFALLAVASGGKKGDSTGEGGTASATGSGAGSIKQSCNQIQAIGMCSEYPKGSTFALAQAACGMMPDAGAVWGKERCPTEKVVGKCVDGTKDALYQDETTLYYAPEYTTDSAKKDCVDEAAKKGKTFTAGDWKPKDDEARASCTRKLIGSKNTGPDHCEEWPYISGKEVETLAVVKMNCSGTGDALEVGKACSKEAKAKAVSKCERNDGAVVYNFPPEAKNAKDFCESSPNNNTAFSGGKYTKLGGAPAAAVATPPATTGAAKGTGAAKPAVLTAPKASAGGKK